MTHPCRCTSSSSSTTSTPRGAGSRGRRQTLRLPAELRSLPRLRRPGRAPLLPEHLESPCLGRRRHHDGRVSRPQPTLVATVALVPLRRGLGHDDPLHYVTEAAQWPRRRRRRQRRSSKQDREGEQGQAEALGREGGSVAEEGEAASGRRCVVPGARRRAGEEAADVQRAAAAQPHARRVALTRRGRCTGDRGHQRSARRRGWTVVRLREEARARGLTGMGRKPKAEVLAALT